MNRVEAVLLDLQRSRGWSGETDGRFVGSGHGRTFQGKPLEPIFPHCRP